MPGELDSPVTNHYFKKGTLFPGWLLEKQSALFGVVARHLVRLRLDDVSGIGCLRKGTLFGVPYSVNLKPVA